MNPLYDAILGGFIGGLLCGPVFVYLGYFLSQRAEHTRRLEQETFSQAKAALIVCLGLMALKAKVEEIPSEPNQVTDPPKQLEANFDSVFTALPRDTILREALELPKTLRFHWMDQWTSALEVRDAAKAVRDRADAILHPSKIWFGTTKKWEIADTKDLEFVRLYQNLKEKRRKGIADLDSALAELTPLIKPLEE